MQKFKMDSSRYCKVLNKNLNDIENKINNKEWDTLNDIYKYHTYLMTKSRKYINDSSSNENQIYVAKLQYDMSKIIKKFLNYVIHDNTIKFDRDTCYELCLMEYYKNND